MPTIIIIAAAILVVALAAFYLVPAVRGLFRDSEVLLYARLQTFAGLALGAIELLASIDPGLIAPFVGEQWMPFVLLLSGILTEVLRRARADDL